MTKHHRHKRARPKKPTGKPKAKSGACADCGEDERLRVVCLQIGGVVVYSERLCRMCAAGKHVKVADSRG